MLGENVISRFGSVHSKKSMVKIAHRDRRSCPFSLGFRLTCVRLTKVVFGRNDLTSSGTCENVSLREVSVFWDVRL